MTAIPFTQFLRPDGRTVQVSIERPVGIMRKAEEILLAGYHFEIEELATGEVYMTISEGDEDFDSEICTNGEAVPDTVDILINRFYAMMNLDETAGDPND
jgi:hypothetical protein